MAMTGNRHARANPLAPRQIQSGGGLIDKSNMAARQSAVGKSELASRSRSRNLSMADQSWTDSLRKTTTTPAKPARVTAICAAVLSASPGSIIALYHKAAVCPRFAAKADGHVRRKWL